MMTAGIGMACTGGGDMSRTSLLVDANNGRANISEQTAGLGSPCSLQSTECEALRCPATLNTHESPDILLYTGYCPLYSTTQ